MKKRSETTRWSRRQWAGAAAWLSGEEGGDRKAAAVIEAEAPEMVAQWRALKESGSEAVGMEAEVDLERAWEKVSSRADEESSRSPRQSREAGLMTETGRQQPLPGRRVATALQNKALQNKTLQDKTLQNKALLRKTARIAAMVLSVTALGWLLFNTGRAAKVTVAKSGGEKNIEIVLTDGSRVFLNSHSTLRYAKNFGEEARQVSLSGEAYFEITEREGQPFVIDAGRAQIVVVGTSFNVITENESNELEVFVASGSVMVKGEEGSAGMTIPADYVGRISERGSSMELNTNHNYLGWHTGMLSYDGERLEVVFQELKRAYNLEIRAADEEINEFLLTSPFERQPNDTIVKLICTTFNLHYIREGGVYILYR